MPIPRRVESEYQSVAVLVAASNLLPICFLFNSQLGTFKQVIQEVHFSILVGYLCPSSIAAAGSTAWQFPDCRSIAVGNPQKRTKKPMLPKSFASLTTSVYFLPGSLINRSPFISSAENVLCQRESFGCLFRSRLFSSTNYQLLETTQWQATESLSFGPV